MEEIGIMGMNGLSLKKECKGTIHKVVEGDTLYRLSKMYGVRLMDIMKENPYVNVYNMQVGEEICIPTEVYEEEERLYYSTKKGDTIRSVMEFLETDLDTLMEYNPDLYDLKIGEGTIIRFPKNKS